MATAVDAFSRVETVVANAGVQPVAALGTMSMQHWREAGDTNLTGSFATVQAAAAATGEQRGGEAIILIASLVDTQPTASLQD